MSTLPVLGWKFVDVNGDPYRYAKLYTYLAGTTTPATAYKNSALTQAHDNPINADTNGEFAQIYLDPDKSYKLALKEYDGTEIQTWDNIDALQLASSSYQERVRQIGSNPLDYGAVGDGVSNEKTAVQSAITNASCTVDLLGKVFRCDSALSALLGIVGGNAESITIENGTLDFSNCTANEYLVASDTSTSRYGSPVYLLANVSANAEYFTITDTSGLAAGDWIYLQSDAMFNGGSDAKGELLQIAAIAGGTGVYTVQRLIDGYTTATNARIRKVDFSNSKNVTLRNLRIICADNASGNGDAVYVESCKDVTLENVRVFSPKGAGFRIEACVNVTARGCAVYGINNNRVGSGFEIGARCRDVRMSDCLASGLDTGIDIGAVDSDDGVTIQVNVHNCTVDACLTNGVILRGNSAYCSVGGNGYPSASFAGSYFSDSGYENRRVGFTDARTDGHGFEATGGTYGDGVIGRGGENGNGVSGYAGGTITSGAGVLGVADDSVAGGYGVKGDGNGNASAIGVYAKNTAGVALCAEGDTTSPARAAFRIVPQDAAPTGPNSPGDIYCTTAGKLYICTSGGTPGTWTVVGTQT